MSERWRNELRKLRGVEPPDDLRARVDHGPTNEPLPGNRQRVVAGVVAFALFAASGAFAWRAFAPSTGGSNLGSTAGQTLPHGVTFIAQANGPRAGFSIRMQVDGVEVDGQSSGFSTTVTNADGTGSTSIGDAAAPEFHPVDFVAIPVGAPLVVLGNATDLTANATDGASLGMVGQVLDLSSGVVPSLSLGKHLLLIRATWEFGPSEQIDHATTGAGMYFPIEIVPASPSTDTPDDGTPSDGVVVVANAHATDDPEDPIHFAIRMAVAGVNVPGASGGWETSITNLDGISSGGVGDVGVPNFKPADYIAVPAGSPLVLETNTPTLDGSASVGADPFEGSQPVDLTTGVVPDLPLGKHVLSVNATWEFGRTATFDHAHVRAGWSFPIEIVPGAAPAAPPRSVLRIDCSVDPVVATSVVAAAAVGVRVRFADRASEREFDLTWSSPDGSPADEHGPFPGNGLLNLPVFHRGRYPFVAAAVTGTQVSIVDPHGLWTSPVLACQDTQRIAAKGSRAVTYADYEAAVRALLTVRGTDEVRTPNYPGTVVVSMLPGHTMVVRDGAVVAALEMWPDRIDGTVCAGTGIGPQP